MKKKNILFFLLCFLLTTIGTNLEQARGMYGRGQYAEAKPVFQKLCQIANRQTVITTYGTVCVASKQVMLPRP